mmetsp:Transcript_9712/g.17509  ORF Transcript_9712/g.17509 Transcript_9712/m.17509 type:complete len:242 (+) Transcript_9712:29-754(+)
MEVRAIFDEISEELRIESEFKLLLELNLTPLTHILDIMHHHMNLLHHSNPSQFDSHLTSIGSHYQTLCSHLTTLYSTPQLSQLQFKFYFILQPHFQSLSYLLILTHFFKHNTLLPYSSLSTLSSIQSHLSSSPNQQPPSPPITQSPTSTESILCIPIEAYLIGICSCINEMTRLGMNRVINGDLEFIKNAIPFASDVYASFQLLNLKNDAIRRKFDAMKYDIRKLEQIQFDLIVRKLLPST